jgi:hypothetical protein
MPYIPQNYRWALRENEYTAAGSGELSYQLTAVIDKYLESHPNGGWEGAIAPVLAAIEGARIAFINEIVTPYEDLKKKENGKVFHDWQYIQKSS